MSKSGRNYTKEKIRQRHIANKKRKHPIRLFIKYSFYFDTLIVPIIQ